jgi:hypothetical protein
MLSVPRMSPLACLVLSACLVCLAPARCAAWGNRAHHIIAMIALSRLTPKARERAQAILGKDDFVACATYADEVRILRPDTAGWHFVDIPANSSSYIAKRDCVDGNCLVAVVERFQRALSSPKFTRAGPEEPDPEALKFLIHLVGDLGQPFHCYDNNDRGGNAIRVMFFNKLTNLHAVWDTYMIEHMLSPGGKAEPLTEEAYAQQLIDLINNPKMLAARHPALAPQGLDALAEGRPEDWAVDSHLIAQKAAVLDPPAEPALRPPKPPPARTPVGRKRKATRVGTTWAGETAFYFVQPVAWGWGVQQQQQIRYPEISVEYYSHYSPIVEQQLIKSGLRLARLLNEALDGRETR